MSMELRDQLVATALEWQRRYGVAPAITSTLSEYDAAMLLGCTEEDYSRCTQHQTAVQRGHDFIHAGIRYQVKANRPSGRPGSPVTLVSKAKNYEWDQLIWVLYNTQYVVQEAWRWEVGKYREAFHEIARISPQHMRQGQRLK